MSIYDTFNFVEGLLWWGVALLLARKATDTPPHARRPLVVAALAFVLFGITDWLEPGRAGRLPLWLWALKVICGVAILWARYEWRGWRTMRWHDRELLFSAGCLLGVATAMMLQATL